MASGTLEVFSSRMNPVFHCTGQMADSVYQRFADVNVVDRVAHGGGGFMVWAGVCYGQWTRVHFIDGILNAQRYRDEILSPIVVPLIHDHHLMLQHDNARPHAARICTQFLEAENIPVLAWLAYSPDMCHPLSMFGMLWIGVYNSMFQFLPISSNFAQPLKRSGPTFHRPQSTTWSTLCEGDVLHCVRQMVVTPDTDWFIYIYIHRKLKPTSNYCSRRLFCCCLFLPSFNGGTRIIIDSSEVQRASWQVHGWVRQFSLLK